MSGTCLTVLKNDSRGEKHRSGAAAYAKAALRYNFRSPTFLGSKGQVLAIKDDGTKHQVPAESVAHDLEYVVPVKVGTPGVELKLDFDTGSADLWVWSSKLKASQPTNSEISAYDPSKSSTSEKVEGGKWSISYGDGSQASGIIFKDDLQIGDLKVEKQGIEVAEKISSSFLTDSGSDGLLGLAWPKINTAQPRQNTPVQNLIEKGITSEGIFSVCLKHEGDGKGFYSFGCVMAKEAGVKEEDISYTEVDNKQGFWAFQSDKVKIADQLVDTKDNVAIMDTGTTLALMSESVVTALYSRIPGAVLDHTAGGFVYPVDAQAPDVQIAVGEKMYTIKGNNLAYGTPTNGMVFGGIQSRGNNPFDILGDTFLKSIYVVFDQSKCRIGVAQRETSKSTP